MKLKLQQRDRLNKQSRSSLRKRHKRSALLRKRAVAATTATLCAATAGTGMPVYAQQAGTIEEVVVTGIRRSLEEAREIKRAAGNLVDSVAPEDVGKFPDLNVAESLQRVTGVSIDRDGGEGQAVTVRGFGPQFNTVLVNGRQLATDSGGREFNFDVLSAEQMTGAYVYKSPVASQQEGGIGSTINLTTARPLDRPGLYYAGSVKGIYETLSEDIAPSFSGIVSNTFNDDTVGVLFSATYQERDVQINRIETAGWRPGLTISDPTDITRTGRFTEGANPQEIIEATTLASNVYIPRNWDQIVDQQERTRLNASLVVQFAPSEDLTITLDGSVSRFEVDSLATDLASWFEPDRVSEYTIDEETRTLLSFNQVRVLDPANQPTGFSGNPATDFVSHTRNSRDVSNSSFGVNVEWHLNEAWSLSFDASTSSAENDRAGRDRFNVIGIINDYNFDGTGGTPTVEHLDFADGNLPDINRNRLHYNERGNRPTDEDEISEFKVDVVHTRDEGPLQSVAFGAYRQAREKSQFQRFASQCGDNVVRICGYNIPAPVDALNIRPFQADNFFSGLIDRFYTYDGDAYLRHLASIGFPVEPALQNNRYTVEEDITSLYVDLNFEFDMQGMPLIVGLGLRYSDTDVEVAAIQAFLSDIIPTTDLTLFSNEFSPATGISQGTSYDNLLPSVNVKLELNDEMVLRFAAYQSLTRPTLSQMSPATTFGEPRRQNLTASGGNPALQPFSAVNFDLSYEWYYGEASSFTVAFFRKDVDDFITTLTGTETYTLSDRTSANGFRCTAVDAAGNDLCADVSLAEELVGESEEFMVTRPQNGEEAEVTGYEVAITHVFPSGFGVSANGTFVSSDATLGSDASDSFALEGLGDSQNLVLFYEQDRYQVRLAYNRREEFLRRIDNGFNGEPVNTETYEQLDLRASYDVNDNVQVFLDGINITEEELSQFGRFANQTFNIEDNGARWALGVRARF